MTLTTTSDLVAPAGAECWGGRLQRDPPRAHRGDRSRRGGCHRPDRAPAARTARATTDLWSRSVWPCWPSRGQPPSRCTRSTSSRALLRSRARSPVAPHGRKPTTSCRRPAIDACDACMLVSWRSEVSVMAMVTVRNLDERVKARLQQRAARRGRSMEAEVRQILADAVAEDADRGGIVRSARRHFGPLGIDQELAVERSPERQREVDV